MSTLFMQFVGQKLRKIREKAGFTLRKAAISVNVDAAVLSKMERGERRLNKNVIIKLAELYNADLDELLAQYIGEKVFYDLKDENFGAKALEVAEKSIMYYKTSSYDLKELIRKSLPVITENNRIEKAWIFGSFARNEQKPDSDLDIMIKIKEGTQFSLFDFADIQFQLENVLGLKVDIVEEDALSPLVREDVIAERVMIYER